MNDLRIGIGITTRNRRETLLRAIQMQQQFSPGQCVVPHPKRTEFRVPSGILTSFVVVDDGSDVPLTDEAFGRSNDWGGACWSLIRNDDAVGYARAKNQCLAFLMRCGVDELFLFDDDAWPVAADWWRPYVESSEPMHTWCFERSENLYLGQLRRTYRDGEVSAYGGGRGCMIHVRRSVVDRVGGMDPQLKMGSEDLEYLGRAHAAGLTSFRFQDVVTEGETLHSEDQHNRVVSTLPMSERESRREANERHRDRMLWVDRFVPYRGAHDVVLTCLLTSKKDPQRDAFMDDDARLASRLLSSLSAHGVRGVVLHDNDLENESALHPPHLSVQVDTYPLDPYVQRWVSYRRWLIAHPEVEHVWCVDATDVELLREPFSGLERGTLYVGTDEAPVGCDWMWDHHPGSRSWIETHGDATLLNPGVVGGERAVLLQLCGRIFDLHVDATRRGVPDQRGDMGYFNRAVHEMREAGISVVSGPRITTPYKGYVRNDWSLWKHK